MFPAYAAAIVDQPNSLGFEITWWCQVQRSVFQPGIYLLTMSMFRLLWLNNSSLASSLNSMSWLCPRAQLFIFESDWSCKVNNAALLDSFNWGLISPSVCTIGNWKGWCQFDEMTSLQLLSWLQSRLFRASIVNKESIYNHNKILNCLDI